ncbi:MAG TPA: hypothetical protein ENI60_03230 [Candidatus Fraserbacteria bacterium]|nr:hypothetical protein [Candidatus Fraserbacteria bacterium]
MTVEKSDAGDEVLAEIVKSEGEKIVVKRTTFKGNKYVDIRVYYDAGEEWKPTRKGIALRPELVGQVIEALRKADEGNSETPAAD